MTDRRLVVYEADLLSPGGGGMFALPPGQAPGIGLPAFRFGAGVPTTGDVEGDAFYDTITKTAFVWNGTKWLPIAPTAIVTYPDEAAMLADKAQPPGSYGASAATGTLYIMTTTGWRASGIRSYPTEVELFADPAADGTVGVALDTGIIFGRSNGAWHTTGIRYFPTIADLLADTTSPDGTHAVTVDRGQAFIRVAGVWKPATAWSAAEALILADTVSPEGSLAVASDTGHTFVRSGSAWIGSPIVHYPTEADLLAATQKDGVLAWADDTGKVFGHSQGVWRYLTDSVVQTDTGVGAISMFSVAAVPHSHLVCDGSTFDKTLYPQLFDFLGTDKLPDLRDKFLRGWSAARPPMNLQGQATARPTTPFTTNDPGNHKHVDGGPTLNGWAYYGNAVTGRTGFSGGSDGGRVLGYTSEAGAHSHTITGGGDTETRPANIAIVFAIQALPLTANTLVKPAPPIVGWVQATWPKNSVVVHNGTIWHALEDIPSTDANSPASPKWETLTGGGVTIGTTAPTTPANGDLWLDASYDSDTRGLNVWSGTEWRSFGAWSIGENGGLLPAPGYLNQDPSETTKPTGMVGIAFSYSGDAKLVRAFSKRRGAGYIPLTPPLGDAQHAGKMIVADNNAHPVWGEKPVSRIATIEFKSVVGGSLGSGWDKFTKIEIDAVWIPRSGDDTIFLVLSDSKGEIGSASGNGWSGSGIETWGSGGSNFANSKTGFGGTGDQYIGMGAWKKDNLVRIRITVLNPPNEWGSALIEAEGLASTGGVVRRVHHVTHQGTIPLTGGRFSGYTGQVNDGHGVVYGYP